jgi:hypothetical protein
LLKRLNLAKFHCETLDIALHVKLSPALGERILMGSHGHKKGGEAYFALYAATYTVGKLPHAVQATVLLEEEEYHVEFEYWRKEMPRPPKGWKSVQGLVAALEEEPQAVTVECDAYLGYDEESGWKSALEIPQPVASKEENPVFTHIEAIKLSHREEDKVRYSVQIRRTESGDLRHWVHLSSEERLSPELPERLLERAAELSRALLRRHEEVAPDGH